MSDFLKGMTVSYGRRHGKSKVLQEYIAKHGHKTTTIKGPTPPITMSPTTREQFDKLWHGTPEKTSFPGLRQMHDTSVTTSNSADASENAMTVEKLKRAKENMAGAMGGNVETDADGKMRVNWRPGISIPSLDDRTEKDKRLDKLEAGVTALKQEKLKLKQTVAELTQENGELRAEVERLTKRIAALEEQVALDGDW